MARNTLRIVLASRSPRRKELLEQLLPHKQIEILPPSSPEELSFDGLDQRRDIEARLKSIAVAKCDDVLGQLGEARNECCVIAADTTIIVSESDGRSLALGQPPESNWQETVRHWFLDYYAGRSHVATTGVCVSTPTERREILVSTTVRFRCDVTPYLESYLATGEPIGKAGGYAIQGAGSIFVERIDGSMTNVIGLPMAELADSLRELDVV